MKSRQYLIMIGIAASSLVACENNSAKDEQLAADIDNYVDSVTTNVSNYTKETWDDISATYAAKKLS
jgi:hypothetical protein